MMIKRNKILTLVAGATLTAGLMLGTVQHADAAPRKNPWTHGLVIHNTKRLTVGDWKRYAKSKGAHHLGKIDGHKRCYVVYGPTSYGQCKDGYRFTS